MSVADQVERLTRRRARLAIALGVIFLVTQVASFDDAPLNRPATVHLGAWVLWAAALLVFLATGGGLVRGRGLRGYLNDEGTRAHRLRASAVGFWFAIGTALLLYGLALFEPVTAREGARLVVTVAVAAALIRFGTLERRAIG